MASNSREARRRKILERGSDRLAFITGQVNGVPPPPPSDSTSFSQSDLRTDESLPDTIPPRDQIRTARGTAFTSQLENISDASMLDNSDHIIPQSRPESVQPRKYTETLTELSASLAEASASLSEASASLSGASASLSGASASLSGETTVQQSPATSSARTPSVVDLGASQAFTPLVSFVNTITPKHIKAAIEASEYERMFLSLVIALFVILHHLGFSAIGNIVSFKPVFLLLLTDVTIVLGRVLLSNHGNTSSSSSRLENSGTVMNEQGIVDQVSNALEMVMMMKKIMDAMLMDFSLYVVFLICGLLFTKSIVA